MSDASARPQQSASRRWRATRPVHARVGNRQQLSVSRPGWGPPEAWFDVATLSAAGLYAVSFDFFINWSTGSLEPILWMKRSAVEEPGGVAAYDEEAVTAALAVDPSNFVEAAGVYELAMLGGLSPAWAIIPEWFSWEDGRGHVLLCPFGQDGRPTKVEVVSWQVIQTRIYRHTGEYFVPQKGLYWSYTTLEAALSKTRTPWPGDADVVLVSAVTHEARAVVEMKKHTKGADLVSSFHRYYRTTDRRRWDRLAMLAQGLPGQPPLLGLFYSTQLVHDRVLVHEIQGTAGALSAAAESMFSVPTTANEAVAFTDSVMKHYKIHG